MSGGIVITRDRPYELVLAVNNRNTGKIESLFKELHSEKERSELARTKDPLHNSRPVLYTAIIRGFMDVYKLLLDNGASLTDPYGPNEAIHVAAMWGNTEAADDIILNRVIAPGKNKRNVFPSNLAKNRELSRFLRSHEPKSGAEQKEGVREQQRMPGGHTSKARTYIRQDRSGS